MEPYVYDRPVCTGLGDRVGALMTLATLARINQIEISFEWCTDPSQVYGRIHPHIPRWCGYDYNVTDFQDRFWPHSSLVKLIPTLSFADQRESRRKIVYEGLSVPAEAGLDQIYTTACKAVEVPGRPAPEPDNFKRHYRWVARAVVLHAMKKHPQNIEDNYPYVAVHMRAPDRNTYSSFLGFHDNPKLYCTGRVLRRVLKHLPGVKVFVVTNNATWASQLLEHPRLDFRASISAYDDLALLLGASAIVQHSGHGWSAFSSNPAMMSGSPLITTYKRHLQHHRLGLFDQYGGAPSEFHDCTRIDEFVSEAYAKIFHFI
jgi:hypothetical protein